MLLFHLPCLYDISYVVVFQEYVIPALVNVLVLVALGMSDGIDISLRMHKF